MGKLHAMLGVMALCLAARAAEASPPVYHEDFRGDPYIQWAYPDGDSVNEDCFGNCGRGCDDAFNPCGGRSQYWVQRMLDEPQYSHFGGSSSCDTFTGTLYLYNVFVHTAAMHETYNGFATLACRMHDNTCGSGIAVIGCLWPPHPFCPFDREDRTWEWDVRRQGWLYELADVVPAGCPCIGDQICPF